MRCRLCKGRSLRERLPDTDDRRMHQRLRGSRHGEGPVGAGCHCEVLEVRSSTGSQDLPLAPLIASRSTFHPRRGAPWCFSTTTRPLESLPATTR